MGKLSTETIKNMIPAWLTDQAIAEIRAQFDEPNDPRLSTDSLRNPKNWRRIHKSRGFLGRGWERIFDYRPAEDQLRLYVYSDDADETVVEYFFSAE
jgi:hypothetical protein